MTPLARSLVKHLPWDSHYWWLAVSGGMDSMCLLALINEIKQASEQGSEQLPKLPPIGVIHINHGLQAAAKEWQTLVETKAHTLGLICISETVVLDTHTLTHQGEEAAARQARYQVFAKHVQAGQTLLLAHHANDQAETLLLRLCRGAGIAGLRGMPRHRQLATRTNTISTQMHPAPASLHRPLLAFSRQDLTNYANAQALVWCDDPSNQSSQQDRNFLRQQILPLLTKRWPGLLKKSLTTTKVMEDTHQLITDLAKLDGQAFGLDTHPQQTTLSLPQLIQLSTPRRHNLIRWWLTQQGEVGINYHTQQLIEAQIIHLGTDKHLWINLTTGRLTRHNHQLVWLSHAELAFYNRCWQPEIWHWDTSHQLASRHKVAQGYLMCRTGGLALKVGDTLTIKPRQGGEYCQPQQRQHRQRLKKILQELNIPHWQRNNLPLFYINGELAMVADLFVCQGFVAANNQPGWIWQADLPADKQSIHHQTR